LPKLSVKEKLILRPKKEKSNFKNVVLSDIEKIVLIEEDCHISPWSKTNFLDSISSGNLFQVLKDDELIIGYYIASFAADECELLNITVNKHFHRQGFGKIKGFNEVGIRPNYYKTTNGNEDAILMAFSF
jgi:ribosomal protein S18 acetylase RimI-like enzyme